MLENWDQYEDLEYYPDRVCKCGCGGRIKVHPRHKYRDSIPEYIHGHNRRGKPPWNKNLTKEVVPQLAKSEEVRKKMGGSRGKYSEEYGEACGVRMIKQWKDPNFRDRMLTARTVRYGPDTSQWQGGISNLPYPFEFNKEFKELVRERYNYTCMICKLTQEQVGYTLIVHHIDYDKDNLDPDNFVPLCRSCHGATIGRNNRVYWTKVLQNVVEKYLILMEFKRNEYSKSDEELDAEGDEIIRNATSGSGSGTVE